MFIEKIIESKQKSIKIYPVNSNRASELGHECLRYLVLQRTRWQEKALHDVYLQMIFDLGNDIERIVLREMEEAGVKVIEQQRSYEWKEYKITGHVDGKILGEDANIYPFDIKSSSPYVFDSIHTLDDLRNGKYPYLRKYPTQLNLYLLMDGQPRGLFIFKNKVSGQFKEIWMDLDYDLGEETLKKAEAINSHVDNGTLPDQIEYDEQVCGRCTFAHVCAPDRIGTEVIIPDTDELSYMITRLMGLKEAHTEYNSIDKEIAKIVKGKEKILAGDWFISGKWIDRKGFTVEPTNYWKKSIMAVPKIYS